MVDRLVRPSCAVLTCVVAIGVAGVARPTGQPAHAPFVDDAGRTVAIPARVGRVFAAGAPAEVLLYTWAPTMLVGRNRVPDQDALPFMPFREFTLIRQLPEVDNPAADAELVALRPDLYVDYGTVQDDYVRAVEAVQNRTKVPGVILDGALSRIPEVYRRLGTAFMETDLGESFAADAESLLTKYRGRLAQPEPVRVYLACSTDGVRACLADEPAGEVLAWLGGVNVAGTRATAPRRPVTVAEIRAMAPQVIVTTGGPDAVARIRSDPQWQAVDAVAKGRVVSWPGQPYSWGPRPPSVNRLPGVMWLAYVAAGRPFDGELARDLRAFYRRFYHLQLTDAHLRTLLGS